MALNNKNARQALNELNIATPYEMGSLGHMESVYLRGRAYLMQHNGGAASTEFQKILKHPGIVEQEPAGLLSRLGLARALVLQGDTTKARTAYQDFLTLWRDADPDIPILQQAKAEYGKLR